MKTNPTKYFLYARKSTTGDEKQVLSIPAQRQALTRFATQNQLEIVEIIEERCTAHAPGRPNFNAMMQRIEAGEANGILAWHPDRLARNSLDGGQIIHSLDVGTLVDLKFFTFWFENTPQGKSNLGHEFVQTKQFSDKLSCDTRRGLQQKARMGIYPSVAPRGYLNDKATKTIFPDPHVAPIIKKAFELYADGNQTLEQMRTFFQDNGILSIKRGKRFKGGRLVHVDWVRRVLRNPFYYGHFEYGGEHFEGKHKPIITKELFDKVQAVLERRTHKMAEQWQPEALTGLLKCGECRCSITAEVQKGHVYYRCTKKNKAQRCSQKYIRQEELDRQLSGLLSPRALPPGWAEGMLALADQEEQAAVEQSDSLAQEQQAKLANIKAALDRLTSAYIVTLDIDRDVYLTQKEKLLSEKKTIQEILKSNDLGQHRWLEPLRKWINTAKTLGEIAEHGGLTDKKAVAAKVFGSNLYLESKKARGEALEPYSLLVPQTFLGEMVPRLGLEPRTN